MVDLLVLTSLYQLLLKQIFFYFCYKTNYLNEVVNCTELSPSVTEWGTVSLSLSLCVGFARNYLTSPMNLIWTITG